MNNIVKNSFFIAGGVAASFMGMGYLKVSLTEKCSALDDRVEFLKIALNQLAVKIMVVEKQHTKNCYYTTKMDSALNKNLNKNIVSELSIFDELLVDLKKGVTEFKQKSSEMFEISKSYEMQLLPYKCMLLETLVEENESSIKQLYTDYHEMMEDNFARFCPNQEKYLSTHFQYEEIRMQQHG